MERKIDIKEYNKTFLEKASPSMESQVFSEALNEGIAFQRKGADYILKRVRPEESALIQDIVSTVCDYEQLVPVDFSDVQSVAASGLALCVVTDEGEFAAYLGAETPEQYTKMNEKFHYLELRTSITAKNHTRRGLNSTLKVAQIINVLMMSGKVPVAFTDEIPAVEDLPDIKSGAIGINHKLNLINVPIGELPEDYLNYMVDPCPDGRCVYKADCHPKQSACMCSVWLPDIHSKLPTTGIEILDKAVEKYWEEIQHD